MDEKYDLYNNPMVDMARQGLTKEQVEDYKKMGEYMYSTNFNITEAGSVEKPPDKADILQYAIEGLKSGLHPTELSETELQNLIEIYGDKWYEKYGWEACDVPLPTVQAVKKPDQLIPISKPKPKKPLEATKAGKMRTKNRKPRKKDQTVKNSNNNL